MTPAGGDDRDQIADIDAKLPWARDCLPLPELRPDERKILPAGTLLARIFFRGGDHPVTWNEFRDFGPTGSRFDHHLGSGGDPAVSPDRAILYLAAKDREYALTTCIAECFQRASVVDLRGREPWFVVFETTRAIACLDLHGLWPNRAGASTAMSSGPKRRSQDWSREIYGAYVDLDGIAYPSSEAAHSAAFALYERARDALPATPLLHRALADPDLRHDVAFAAKRLGKTLI